MKTNTSVKNRSGADDSTTAAALWVLAATAWFVMAVLFVRHGLFSATLLLLIALICLPGMRAAFRQQTGIRIPGLATAAAIIALAVGSFTSAGRNLELQQSGPPLASGGADGESMGPTHSETAAPSGLSVAQTLAIAGTGP